LDPIGFASDKAISDAARPGFLDMVVGIVSRGLEFAVREQLAQRLLENGKVGRNILAYYLPSSSRSASSSSRHFENIAPAAIAGTLTHRTNCTQ
jgi:hypothetical protein